MLSPEIDLTANGDFGLGVGFFMDTPIEIPLDEYASMSRDEYEALLWWEGIFGKRRHQSIKRILFPKLGYDVPNLPRIPWKRRYDNIRNLPRIPWKQRFHQSTDDRGWNLFARR